MKILFVNQVKETSLCSSTAYTQVCTKNCLVCDKQYQATALEGSSYTCSACLLKFWLTSGLQDSFAHYYGLGLCSKWKTIFFLWIFTLQSVFYCDFTDMFVLHCTREPVFVQRLGYWWHKNSYWKPSSLSFQQDKPWCLCEIFLLQDQDLL